jgi:hypothetical protein
MKAILITFLLIAMAAGSSMARPEESSSTTESIAELEDDLDTDNSTEIISDDVHCEEVEKLKDFYCTTAHCKHFYSKHCYDIIDGVHPTCEKVRACIESRVSKFQSKTEKNKDTKVKNGSNRMFLSLFSFFPMVLLTLGSVARL